MSSPKNGAVKSPDLFQLKADKNFNRKHTHVFIKQHQPIKTKIGVPGALIRFSSRRTKNSTAGILTYSED